MEMGEKIAVSGLQEEIDADCPFCEDVKGATEKEDEHIANDDRDSVQDVQANNGGVLGSNLNEALNGKAGTWQGAPYEPPSQKKSPANDSRRKDGKKLAKEWIRVRVPGTREIKTGDYPFTVAAHHLIPGNASLYAGKNKLQNYLIQGKTVTADGQSWKIKYHIGYNVNGAHNGEWTPGNYAIRASASPVGKSWSAMGNADWQLHYVAACVKATGRQFHDTHEEYSDAVLKLLNKIVAKLRFHQARCTRCQAKGGHEIPPPYLIKERLYRLSAYFRQQLNGNPAQWRRPWFTSNRWRKVIFPNDAEAPCSAFMDAYNQASVIKVEDK